MKLSKVNEAHKNMDRRKRVPLVTDFGPPRRKPGRKARRSNPAKAVYVGPNAGRRPGRYKPNAPNWKAVHYA